MNNLKELRQTSLDFRRLSSNFLKSTNADNFLYVKRLYAYLNEQAITKQILSTAISSSDYDCAEFITKDDLHHRCEFNVPINETDHVKAMHSFLEDLATTDYKRLHSIAASFVYRKKIDETIQIFLEKSFKPLIDFITDALSKEIMALEQSTPATQFNQHIGTNYGTANAGASIVSTQTNGIDASELAGLIEVVRKALSGLSDEDKESVQEYMEVIETELSKAQPKKSFLKTAMAGLKAIKGSVEFSAAVSAIMQFVAQCCEVVL